MASIHPQSALGGTTGGYSSDEASSLNLSRITRRAGTETAGRAVYLAVLQPLRGWYMAGWALSLS